MLYFLEFDTYFTSLVPGSKKLCQFANSTIRSDNRIVNCRNVWFREFWKSHFNCSFSRKNKNKRLCTGEEKIIDFTEEGLVPFVSKYFTSLKRINKSNRVYMLFSRSKLIKIYVSKMMCFKLLYKQEL